MNGISATASQWTGIISNVGFPIAAFLLMYRLARETIKENTEALQELQTEISNMKRRRDSGE